MARVRYTRIILQAMIWFIDCSFKFHNYGYATDSSSTLRVANPRFQPSTSIIKFLCSTHFEKNIATYQIRYYMISCTTECNQMFLEIYKILKLSKLKLFRFTRNGNNCTWYKHLGKPLYTTQKYLSGLKFYLVDNENDSAVLIICLQY